MKPADPMVIPSRYRSGSWALLAGLFLLLGWVLVSVVNLKFASGEHYPHYSTWKSEPLGARALFESCQRLDGMTVSRNLAPLNQFGSSRPDTTFLLLGIQSRDLGGLRVSGKSGILEGVRRLGGRLVITINPQLNFWGEEPDWVAAPKIRQENPDPVGAEAPGSSAPEKSQPGAEPVVSPATPDFGLPGEMGFQVASHGEMARPGAGWQVTALDRTRLPDPLPQWWSSLHFSQLTPEWEILATVLDHPVVVRRDWGVGEVILASDSFFASNQALRESPQPAFLSYLLGDARRVVFDETIHGAKEDVGVMALVREHGLTGFFYGLLVFLALFAWRGASSLVPRNAELDRGLSEGALVGLDAGSGLARLLRSTLRGRDLLATCVEIWKRDVPHASRNDAAEMVAEVEKIAAESGQTARSVVEGYARITESLKIRQGKR